MNWDELTDEQLLELESQYCSYGDTVHYIDPAKIFESRFFLHPIIFRL